MNDINENNRADIVLVEKVLSGNTNAFSNIIADTERLVTQIVFKMISNNEDRKDIAQDVYLKAFKNLSGFKYQSKLSTWIGKIAYNTCLNYIEKKKLVLVGINIQEKKDYEDEPAINNNPAINYTTDIDVFINNKELTKILTKEIEALPTIYKTLITLYHNEELSYSEIAQITELPEGTIKSYLYRARKMLKENLSKNYKKDEL